MRRDLLVLALAALAIFPSCSGTAQQWAQVRQADTIPAYEAYLARHPEGEAGEQARARLRVLREEEAWRAASAADSRDAYEAYLAVYPSGRNAEHARDRIVALLIADLARTEAEPAERTAARRGLIEQGERAVPPLLAALASGGQPARAELFSALVTIGQVRVDPLLLALTHANPDVRLAAAEALGRLADPRSVAPLAAALRDESPEVRQAAVAALSRMSGAATDALLPALRDRDPLARRSAATALGRLRAEQAIRPLVGLLADPDGETQRSAVAALAVIGDPAGPALLGTLRHPDPRLRQAAAEVLGLMAYHGAIEPLVQAAADGDPAVRRAAGEALAQMALRLLGDLRSPRLVERQTAVEGLARIGPSVVPVLLRTLGEADPLLRLGAAEALGRLRAPEAARPLVELLGDRADDVRYAAADALVAVGGAAVAPVLALLRSERAPLRDAARRILSRVPAADAMAPLAPALGDPDPRVRDAVAEVLTAMGRPAVAPLLPYLEAPEYEVRRAAAAVLGRIGDDAAVLPLLRAHRDPTMRSWVVEALTAMQAVEPTLEALAAPDPQVRTAAADALGEIASRRGVPALQAALGDPEREVRWAAARALAHLRAAEAVPALVAALRDPDPVTRGVAADALAAIGEPAMDPLVATLDDPDPGVRSAAASALGSMRDPRAVRALVHLLRDRDEAVRRSSVAALTAGGPEALPAILAIAPAVAPSQRRLLADVLGDIPDVRARAWLAEALRDQDAGVRERAAAALGRQRAGDAVAPLVGLLRDREERVRVRAAAALAAIGLPAVGLLLAAARDEALRPQAVAAVVEIGADAAPALVRALADAATPVRVAALDALGEIGEEATIPTLVGALQDPERSVRWRAAWALEMFGPDVPPARIAVDSFLAQEGVDLAALAGDVHPALKQGQDGAIVLALERYGTPEMAEALLRAAPRLRVEVDRWARLRGYQLAAPSKRAPIKPAAPPRARGRGAP